MGGAGLESSRRPWIRILASPTGLASLDLLNRIRILASPTGLATLDLLNRIRILASPTGLASLDLLNECQRTRLNRGGGQ